MPAHTRTRAARPDAIRSHNLGLVLADVHRAGTRSRSELTRRTGLTRSTIGALVTELCSLGLVVERRPESHVRAGRPSHVVEAAPDGPFVVAVSIEIDTIVVAGVGLGGLMLCRLSEAVPEDQRSPEQVATRCARLIGAVIDQMPGRARPMAVGVSVPGVVRGLDGTIVIAPNLNWRDVPMPALIADRLPAPLPVLIGNDADLGALSESLRGVARDCSDLIFINGRIGVGGGVISDGRQLHGAGGFAGELGHMGVDPSGAACHCGGTGCWETKISEQRLLALAGHPEAHGPEAVAEILAAADAGQPTAVGAVTEVCEWIGRGLGALTNIFNPEMIVVGGSLGAILSSRHDQIRAAMVSAALPGSAEAVTLVAPALGPDATLLGAAELAFGRLLLDPLRTMSTVGA
jgi:predicted NBD/HSP70 family sugar kinase